MKKKNVNVYNIFVINLNNMLLLAVINVNFFFFNSEFKIERVIT